MDTVKINTKKNLNANNLIELLREEFSSINDTRDANKSIELIDILMSAYAIFSATHVRLDSLTIKATRFQVPFLLPLAIKTARWKELNI